MNKITYQISLSQLNLIEIYNIPFYYFSNNVYGISYYDLVNKTTMGPIIIEKILSKYKSINLINIDMKNNKL